MLTMRISLGTTIAAFVLLAPSQGGATPTPIPDAGGAGAKDVSADWSTIPVSSLYDLNGKGERSTSREGWLVDHLREWLSTQNGGDFETYSALYSDDFEGLRQVGRRAQVLRYRQWVREARRTFEKTKKVWISDVLITSPLYESTSTLLQADFLEHRQLDDAKVETNAKRLAWYSCSSKTRKICVSVEREDTLATWSGDLTSPAPRKPEAKRAFAIVAGTHATRALAEQARAKYLEAGLPAHDAFPRILPSAEVGLPTKEGFALVVACPSDQRVGAILADFITRFGVATFMYQTGDIEAEDLHVVTIDAHRVTIGDLARVVDEVGKKLPRLRWEVHQTCSGCGDLTPRGTSVALKSNATILPYTIKREKGWGNECYVQPKLPPPLDEKSQQWGYYNLGFDWRANRGDTWSRGVADHFPADKSKVVRLYPGTIRYTDDPPIEGD
jgi:hypothetical protein